MTLSGHQRRRPAARPDRWLLAFTTLVLALGVVVMHSLGIGHHGPSHLAPGSQPMAMAGAGATQQATQHQSTRHQSTHHQTPLHRSDPAERGVAPGHGGASAAGDDVSHEVLHEVGVGSAGHPASIAERVLGAGASHGATAMCLAVLPLLVLLRRRSGGAWFARAVAATKRAVPAAPGAWSIERPRPAGSILTELCILRT